MNYLTTLYRRESEGSKGREFVASLAAKDLPERTAADRLVEYAYGKPARFDHHCMRRVTAEGHVELAGMVSRGPNDLTEVRVVIVLEPQA